MNWPVKVWADTERRRLADRSRIFSALLKSITKGGHSSEFKPVLWIRDNLVRIRIRGSIQVTYGSGSCSFRQWPQDEIKFCLMTAGSGRSKNIGSGSHNTGLNLYFWHFLFHHINVLQDRVEGLQCRKWGTNYQCCGSGYRFFLQLEEPGSLFPYFSEASMMDDQASW